MANIYVNDIIKRAQDPNGYVVEAENVDGLKPYALNSGPQIPFNEVTGIQSYVKNFIKEHINIQVTNGTVTKTYNGDSVIFNISTNSEVPEELTYYWYVGQTDPSTMTSISPIVTDTSSPGWRLIGTTLPTYSSSNKLFEYVEGGEIITGTSLAKQYIAIPTNSSACPRDGLGNDASTVDMYTKLSNVTISGVTYKVYETVGKSRKLAIDIY